MPADSRPLGLSATFDVTPEVLRHLQEVAAFDIARVMEKHHRWCRQFAPQVCEAADGPKRGRLDLDLRRFLALPLLFPQSKRTFVPRSPVDLLWHTFILDTTLYRGFCDRVYGRYLDHVPGAHREGHMTENDEEAVRNTVESLNLAFGGYHRSSWTDTRVCICEFL
jgi:hypothetical protein